ASSKRLQKELLALQNDPPPGMTLNEKSVQNSITQWIVDMEGAPGTLYEGEKFQLLFKFSSRYPFDSPQVSLFVYPKFMYLLYGDCLIICRSFLLLQRRPPDNSFYVRTCNKNPKKTKWWYHEIGYAFLFSSLVGQYVLSFR
uniref:UBC core domain-containing protein n=1 Tax=Pavo cristatus TaxID=9049 RepID=A0A8C9EKW6_PAVCR